MCQARVLTGDVLSETSTCTLDFCNCLPTGCSKRFFHHIWMHSARWNSELPLADSLHPSVVIGRAERAGAVTGRAIQAPGN